MGICVRAQVPQAFTGSLGVNLKWKPLGWIEGLGHQVTCSDLPFNWFTLAAVLNGV